MCGALCKHRCLQGVLNEEIRVLTTDLQAFTYNKMTQFCDLFSTEVATTLRNL